MSIYVSRHIQDPIIGGPWRIFREIPYGQLDWSGVTNDDLIRALERESASLPRTARSQRAWDAHHLSSALGLAMKEHQVALDNVIRCNARAKVSNATPDEITSLNLAQAILQERWAALTRAREQAERFLDATSP